MVPSSSRRVVLTILYDDARLDERLIPSHGFSCLVEAGESRILFDTGGDPAVLFYNMGVLGIDPYSLSKVMISHNHWDHVGGLSSILSLNPRIDAVAPSSGGGRLVGDAHIIGPLRVKYKGVEIKELALAVRTSGGVVVVVGCSHPGVERIVEEARRRLSGARIAAIVGGLHLVESGRPRIASTARRLRELGVKEIAACHCTGKRALEVLRELHGGVLPCGVGARYVF